MKRVSVVILNWNGVDMLRKFIPSVMDNSVGEGIEICVADNASSDGSLEMLRSEFPVVRLIELDQNYGFAEGYTLAGGTISILTFWLLFASTWAEVACL